MKTVRNCTNVMGGTALCLLLLGCSGRSSDVNRIESVFSEVPSNWVAISPAAEQELYFINSDDKNIANLNIVTARGGLEFDSFIDSSLYELEQYVPGFSLMQEQQDFLVGSHTIMKRQFLSEYNQSIIYASQYYIKSDDTIYIATYVGNKDQHLRDDKNIDDVIRSFLEQDEPKSISYFFKAYAQNPVKKKVKELHSEINKSLEGFYNGLGYWVKSLKNSSSSSQRIITKRKDTSFTKDDLVMYTGLRTVDPKQHLEYIFDYPEGFGKLIVQWSVEGNGTLLSSIRIKNSFWVNVLSGNSDSFTIRAKVYLSDYNAETMSSIQHWEIPLGWNVGIRSGDKISCPDGQLFLHECSAVCDGAEYCKVSSTRNDGIQCFTCNKPQCREGTQEESVCKKACDGTCKFSYARKEDKQLCFSCSPKEVEHTLCDSPTMSMSHCEQVCYPQGGECNFAYKTTQGQSCYTCNSCQAPMKSLPACAETCSGVCERVAGKNGLFCYQCNEDRAQCPTGQYSNFTQCIENCSSSSDCKKVGTSPDELHSCYVCANKEQKCEDGLQPYADCNTTCDTKCQFVSLSKIDRSIQCFRCPAKENACPDGTGADKSFCDTCQGSCTESRIKGALCYSCMGQKLRCPTGSFANNCPEKECKLGCDRVPNVSDVCYTCKQATDGADMRRIDPPETCISPDGEVFDCKTGE